MPKSSAPVILRFTFSFYVYLCVEQHLVVVFFSFCLCMYNVFEVFVELFEWKVLETLDAVLDVGGVYDPSRDRYDHHQKGFEEVFGHGFTTKLSSAGLVYKVESSLFSGSISL